jgi:hypothetical protein
VERYAVIDTNWDDGGEPLAGWSGHVLGRFMTLDSAKALVLQRMSFGDTAVVVIDVHTGKRVYPPDDTLFSSRLTPSPSQAPVG